MQFRALRTWLLRCFLSLFARLGCSDELVNTVGEVAWGFKSYVYTHWIHPRVVFVAPTLDHINAVPGYCIGEMTQFREVR